MMQINRLIPLVREVILVALCSTKSIIIPLLHRFLLHDQLVDVLIDPIDSILESCLFVVPILFV